MTVPNIINKIQEHGLRSAFLKNYAVIQNAYAKSKSDGFPFWDPAYTNSQNWGISPYYRQNNPAALKEYFKIKEINANKGNKGVGYFYRGSEAQKDINTVIKYLNGNIASDFSIGSSNVAFQLVDGAIISFGTINNYTFSIYLDVNGPKGPNTFGKDIYWLQAAYVHESGGSIWSTRNLTGGTYTLKPLGAANPENLVDDCYKNDKGRSCAVQILKNRSFVIPDKKS